MIRRIMRVIGLSALAVGVTACPQPNDSACGKPANEVKGSIESHISEAGSLRNARTYSPDGSDWTFVSVEHRTPLEIKRDRNGHIMTFAFEGDGGDVVAVDQRARDESSLPDAPFDVRRKGAIESRGCVFNAR